MSSVDLTTYQLCEMCSASFNGEVPVEMVLSLWRSVGKLTSQQLELTKGLRLPQLGVFSMDSKGVPVFQSSTGLAKIASAQGQSTVGGAASGLITQLNYTLLSRMAGLRRSLCEKIYGNLIQCTLRGMAEGRSIRLSMYPLGEISFKDGNIQMTSSDAVSDPGSTRRKISSLQKSNTGGTDALIDRVRRTITERCGSTGIRGLQRTLSIMDDNGDKRLSKDELKFGLRDYGIELNLKELDDIFQYFDRDHNGFVDITEFLVGMRGDLNDRRREIVSMAFNVLDKDRSGYVTVDEIADVYDVSADPDVVSGRKTTNEALRTFLGQWESGEKDGIVTLEEFEDYYKEISASIDGDDYFELMVRNAWRIAGGKGNAANTANLRVLVTDKSGKQSVVTLENELGLKAGDKEEIKSILLKQGVDAASIDLKGGIDKDDGGTAKKRGSRGSLGGLEQGSLGIRRGVPREDIGTRRVDIPQQRNLLERRQIDNDCIDSLSAGRSVSGATAMPNFKVSDQLVRDGKDISALLRKCIYDPPLSFEDLAAKFRVSVVNTCPHISFIYFKTEMKSINGKLTNNDIDAMWALMNPNNSGTIDLSAIHKFLQNRYGKDKKSNPVVGIIERVKTKILARCGQRAGIKGLQRTLSIMDDNGDKRLSKDELKFGLRDYGIELNLKELDDIFQYFDRDHNGFVDITEFLVGMRGDLNDRRREIVSMAFNVLDKDRSGYVTVDEIADVYDVSADPDVVSGRKTTNEALRTFLGQWESGEKDGIVTLEEFEDYYKEISASIDGDDYFELMVRNAWRIAGGKGNAANTANLRVLVTDKSGKQSVVTLENELGLKAGDKEEIKSILLKQGVDAASIDLKGGIDKDDGGTAKKRGSRGSMQRAVHSVFRGLK